ncbi:toll/interleukin-1 receptor domain-containing protein [Alteromonas sp. Cnat2-8]|uniref:toll/interleukin-1 receptor domain-containing protein n=1 Tax=Alteromonas sp. Cnat2-8 TaxID=2917728 RepID=UPI001EF6CBB0|nr:toll/interleukin-1 receptor domain-containing protein [Alteromonas sp. Cnat2-8]
MIFLSHNYNDKPVVEQIAIRLKELFGQDKVFYDAWSIQPGDGIIDRMNQGLGDCELFLFFVSKNSLQSKMVELEWQNAVIKASQGKTKIIPVKLDDCMMPPILMQSLYIDLYGQGLEVALRQVVDVTSGRNTFQKGPQEFSNMRAYAYQKEGKTYVECHAEFYLEPISSFLILTHNSESEIQFNCLSSSMTYGGFNPNIKLNDGREYNAQAVRIERNTAPGFPFVMEISPQNGSEVKLAGVMHEKKQGEYRMLPLVQGQKVT